MLAPEDFPLTTYGAAVFTAQNPQPIMVLSSPALANDIAARLNESEIAAMICDAVANEDAARGRDDGAEAAERCARLIRGREAERDQALMAAAHVAKEPAGGDQGWSLDGAVNDGKPAA